MSRDVDARARRRSFVERVEARFLCPCCRFVFATPTRFPCGNAHAFCFACAEAWFDACASRGLARADAPCPMCRATARASGTRETPDDATADAMRATTAACDCGAIVALTDARAHYETCEITKSQVAPRGTRARGTGRRGETRARRRGDGDDGEDGEDDAYLCTLCAAAVVRATPDARDAVRRESHAGPAMRAAIEAARDADALPDACFHDSMTAYARHVLDAHDEPDAHVPDVCAICVGLPFGDPTRVVADLYEHLRRRHGFDWTLYAPDPRADEYEVLARVVRESLADASRDVDGDDARGTVS